MSRKLFWLTDQQWSRIEPHLRADVRGKERVDDRRVISGIVHVLKSGCRWCDCPPEYGPPTTIYNRFVRWAERGVWEKLFRALAGKGKSTDMKWTHEARPLGRLVKLESEPLYPLPIMPPRAVSAFAVGMWSTHERCPSCPQPSHRERL
jgi:transposase